MLNSFKMFRPVAACVVAIFLAEAAAAEIGPYEANFDIMKVNFEDGPYPMIGHFNYILEDQDAKTRPVAFVFNGGPGASSVYLHMLALGPKILDTPGDGSFVGASFELVDNPHTWLEFADLVFIDPVGTGLSHALAEDGTLSDNSDFYNENADIYTAGAFIAQWLTENNRWMSPVIIAGESYGGTRVSQLSWSLPYIFDVHVDHAILISPYFPDPMPAIKERYSTLAPALILPTYAAVAGSHGLSEIVIDPDEPIEALRPVLKYAMGDFMHGLLRTGNSAEPVKQEFYETAARAMGLDTELVAKRRARVGYMEFADEIMGEGQFVDVYDGSQAYPDPVGDVPGSYAHAPSLAMMDSLMAASVFSYFQNELAVESVHNYSMASDNALWDTSNASVGHSDTLGNSITYFQNLRAFIAGGTYDMVTPWFRNFYLIGQSLPQVGGVNAGEESGGASASSGGSRTRFGLYEGGHMFYMYEKSREAFYKDIREMVTGAAAE